MRDALEASEHRHFRTWTFIETPLFSLVLERGVFKVSNDGTKPTCFSHARHVQCGDLLAQSTAKP